MIQRLLSDPALLVGLVRSLMILAVTFGVGFTDAQVSSVIETTGVVIAVLSLALTGVTRTLTVPKQ